MEAILKTRKSYNVDKKITIKYYLREVKSIDNDDESNKYSLNILLTINRKNNQFKSRINSYEYHIKGESMKDKENSILKNPYFSKAIEREKEVIEAIVRDLKPFDKENFDIKEVYERYRDPRIFLKKAINDFLFYELSKTKIFPELIPFSDFIHPKSYLDYSENKNTKEQANKFKSKIFSFDVLIWNMMIRNNYGFAFYQPTIFDVLKGRFKDAILLDTFKSLPVYEKEIFISEVEELISKYSKY